MAYGVVHLPFYATGFRGDDLEAALSKLAPISLRYGAIRYDVFRSRDDRYKFVLQVEFAEKSQWDAYYYGEEFTDMRAACSSWFAVPLLYWWNDNVCRGELRRDEELVDELA
jgi:quinol monooxygenase YgiN